MLPGHDTIYISAICISAGGGKGAWSMGRTFVGLRALLGAVVCCAIALGAFPAAGIADEGESVVAAQDTETASNVSYLYYASEADARNGKTMSGTHDCTKVKSSDGETNWSADSNDGWYVVEGEQTIDGIIFIANDVHLVLADGAKLTANNAILLTKGKSLTIYAQSTDEGSMGELNVFGAAAGQRGITGQHLTINGGKVTSKGYNSAQGLWVYCNRLDASLIINGGIVEADGGIMISGETSDGMAFNARLQINGGTVTANGRDEGIVASNGDGGTASVTIAGGKVIATGSTAGIKVDTGSDLTIGTGVAVRAGNSKDDAVDIIPAQNFETNHDQTWVQTTVPVTGVKVSPASATLAPGGTAALTATVEPEHALDKSVTWRSSDEGVAKVGKDGKVTAVAAGTATITATANDGSGKSADCSVTVKAEDGPEPAPAKASKPSTRACAAAGTIKASWKAVKGAKSYELGWRVAGGKWKSKKAKGTRASVKGLSKGKLYELRVRAVTDAGKGAWSKKSKRWLKGPSGVRASAGKAGGSVKVSWKRDKKATGGYKVLVYEREGGKAVATVEVPKSKSSVTVTGLKSGKGYYVRMRPLRDRGGSTYSGTLCDYRSVKAK